MIEVGAVASENTNLTIKSAPAPSVRTYAQMGKNEAADVATETVSFEDFLDALNPLQHIPVLSTAYRALTGERISPVSRIAGDALYGGVFGLASAALSAAGAIADEIIAANNDGQSASEFMIASLFGSDDGSVQLAEAAPPPALRPDAQERQKVALLQTPATQSPILEMPKIPAQQASAPKTENAEETQSAAAAQAAGSSPVASGTGMALDRSKAAYGGVMDSAMMASAKENQALALALSGNRGALHAQRALRSNRFETAAETPPLTTQPTGETQEALQKLLNDLQIGKGISHYTNAAQSLPVSENSINIVN